MIQQADVKLEELKTARTQYTKQLEELQEQLDLQIVAMEGMAARVAQAKGCEKVAAVLLDTVYQLQRLRESKTWDAVLANIHVDYGRLVFPRSFGDEALKEQVKAVREACKKGMFFFSILAASRLTSRTEKTLKLPHTSKPQKFCMFVTSYHIFMTEIDVHIFQRIEALVAFELI